MSIVNPFLFSQMSKLWLNCELADDHGLHGVWMWLDHILLLISIFFLNKIFILFHFHVYELCINHVFE